MRSGVIFISVIVFFLSVSAFAYDWLTNPGDGSVSNPYQILNAEQLNAIGADESLWDKHFMMTADIDLSAYTGTDYHVIGHELNPFTGAFDGKGYTITNLQYDSYDQSEVGLFGVVGLPASSPSGIQPGIIKNVSLVDPNIMTDGRAGYIGIVAGQLAEGVIENCTVTNGHVSGVHSVGSIAGGVDGGGTIKNCFAENCQVTGTNYIGGIAGFCFPSSLLESCGFDGIVEGTTHVGGITGFFRGYVITKCYSKGTVEGHQSIGGLIGLIDSGCSVLHSYSQADVTSYGSDNYAGGFVGSTPGVAFFTRCYAAGTVNGDGTVGGFMGIEDDNAMYLYCIWDAEKNPGLPDSGNRGEVSSVYGQSTPDMQAQSTFTDFGWDFVGEDRQGQNDIWRMCIDGTEYPRLSLEYARYGDFACDDGVDLADLMTLVEHWLLSSTSAPLVFSHACDANGDGVINEKDFDVLSKNW